MFITEVMFGFNPCEKQVLWMLCWCCCWVGNRAWLVNRGCNIWDYSENYSCDLVFSWQPLMLYGAICSLRGIYCVVQGLMQDDNWHPCLLYLLIVCYVEYFIPWKMGGLYAMTIGTSLTFTLGEGSITYSLRQMMKFMLWYRYLRAYIHYNIHFNDTM